MNAGSHFYLVLTAVAVLTLSGWTAGQGHAHAPQTFRLAETMTGGAGGEDGASAGPVRAVEKVDLERYAGVWFEIARVPNRFQRQCVGDVTATYRQRPDGRIDVINLCRTADGEMTEARGVARVVDEESSAKLKVRFAPRILSFLPFVWGDYWIIGLADDYSWAVVGEPDRDYLWVLSRTPDLDPAGYAAALDAAAENGYDPGRLVRTPHRVSGSEAQ